MFGRSVRTLGQLCDVFWGHLAETLPGGLYAVVEALGKL